MRNSTAITGRARWPLVVWLVTMAMVAVATGILIATANVQVPTSWGFRGSSSLFGAAAGTVGAIVAIRRPENRTGWLFVAIGFLFATQSLVNEYTIAAILAVPGGLPGEPGIGWLLTWIWVPPVILALVFLPLVFPTGHLLSRRWRPAAWLGVIAMIPFSVCVAIAPGPIQQATFLDNPFRPWSLTMDTVAQLFGLAFIPLMLAIGLGVASLVVRFRAASDDARRQIKWFALAAAIASALDATYSIGFVVIPNPTIVKLLEVLVVLGLLGMPVAAGLAILRYRLYDIDRIISRTISYGLVTALLVGAYAAAVLVLQGPLRSITGGNTIPVAISTLVVAALFQPLRRRMHAVVDRRFNRARFDAERTSADFADRLRELVDLPTLAADLDATVRTAMAPTRIGLWLRQADE